MYSFGVYFQDGVGVVVGVDYFDELGVVGDFVEVDEFVGWVGGFVEVYYFVIVFIWGESIY